MKHVVKALILGTLFLPLTGLLTGGAAVAAESKAAPDATAFGDVDPTTTKYNNDFLCGGRKLSIAWSVDATTKGKDPKEEFSVKLDGKDLDPRDVYLLRSNIGDLQQLVGGAMICYADSIVVDFVVREVFPPEISRSLRYFSRVISVKMTDNRVVDVWSQLLQ